MAGEFAEIASRSLNTGVYPKFLDNSASRLVGGFAAVLGVMKEAKDWGTVMDAQRKIDTFQRTLKPGETAHIVVSASPSGEVSVMRVPTPGVPVISPLGATEIRKSITAPNYNFWTSEMEKAARNKELFDKLDASAKQLIDEERKRRSLPPLKWTDPM